ncbi:MAG: DUF4835 family protein [Bacteroidetes bacterium]|nr:DUF4835 family protein [Bacteroidota bacterium]
MLKYYLSLLFLSGFVIKKYAQELNCQVDVIVDNKVEVTSTEKEILDQLKQMTFDFMNNTTWTKDKFNIEERINCILRIQVKGIAGAGNYIGSISIQSSRPAFNSNYNSVLINFQDDDVQIAFSRNTVLQYAQNQFKDNLTSILAFYAYFIIGMDYDSFSLKGGTPYFTEAQQIVSTAQSTNFAGWKSSESGKKNRFWLVDNILHQIYEPLRECNYTYHREGIDKLYENKPSAKKAMFDALDKLNPIIQLRPNNVNVQNFLYGKFLEFKGVLSDSELKEKTDFVNLLKKLDSGNSSRYAEIMN